MSKQWSRYQLLIMCVGLVFITTACFRDTAESVGAQPVSQLIVTNTSIPTEVPVEATAEVELTEDVVEEVPTETPTSTVTPSATPTFTETAFVALATETLTPDPLLLSLTQTEESDGIVNIGNTIPGGTAVAQNPTQDAQPDDFALTATALIGQLTADAAAVQTQQAIDAGILPTLTPSPTLDPLLFPTTTPLVGGSATNLVPGQDCIHQIRVGETLYKLSLAYGVSVAQMQAASNIANPNLILVGTRVTIPGCGTTGFTPPPTSVPVATASSNLAVGGVVTTAVPVATVTNSLAAQAQQEILNNAQADIQANQVAQGAVPATGSRQYIVQQYDTLFQIAQTFGTTVDAIAALNGITNINRITMGDVLQIP